MTPLNTIREGQSGMVRSMSGGERFISRVTAMGFIPNTHITVLQNTNYGPILVYIRDTQVALGRGEASKIDISFEETTNE